MVMGERLLGDEQLFHIPHNIAHVEASGKAMGKTGVDVPEL